ncbi:MAG: hypothetical protein ACRDT6_07000 [Micromonosporaceae bacterium]
MRQPATAQGGASARWPRIARWLLRTFVIAGTATGAYLLLNLLADGQSPVYADQPDPVPASIAAAPVATGDGAASGAADTARGLGNTSPETSEAQVTSGSAADVTSTVDDAARTVEAAAPAAPVAPLAPAAPEPATSTVDGVTGTVAGPTGPAPDLVGSTPRSDSGLVDSSGLVDGSVAGLVDGLTPTLVDVVRATVDVVGPVLADQVWPELAPVGPTPPVASSTLRPAPERTAGQWLEAGKPAGHDDQAVDGTPAPRVPYDGERPAPVPDSPGGTSTAAMTAILSAAWAPQLAPYGLMRPGDDNAAGRSIRPPHQGG